MSDISARFWSQLESKRTGVGSIAIQGSEDTMSKVLRPPVTSIKWDASETEQSDPRRSLSKFESLHKLHFPSVFP